MKDLVFGSKLFIDFFFFFIMENVCMPTSQVGPEIKHLLHEGMSRKGSMLAKSSGSLDN